MATLTTGKSLNLSPEITNDIFNKVKGKSSLANLSAQTPIPFNGTDIFQFTMDGEAAIVGEGANKPAGEAAFNKVTIKPIKVVYQHRVTDEFIYMAEEKQLNYLEQFNDGFAKKIARAIDIMAFHGLNPADKAKSSIIGDNNFDDAISATVTYADDAPHDNLQSAVEAIQALDGEITGIAMAPAFASAMGKLKDEASSNRPLYPEFQFGSKPTAFNGMRVDVNNTVAFNNTKDRAIVGDFENAFKWGYAENIPMEIIQYGDPDGQGDLKRTNEVVLRAEAYIGWGILDKESFARVVTA